MSKDYGTHWPVDIDGRDAKHDKLDRWLQAPPPRRSQPDIRKVWERRDTGPETVPMKRGDYLHGVRVHPMPDRERDTPRLTPAGRLWVPYLLVVAVLVGWWLMRGLS